MKKRFFPSDENQQKKLIDSVKSSKIIEDKLRAIVGGAWDDQVTWPESTWRDVIHPPTWP